MIGFIGSTPVQRSLIHKLRCKKGIRVTFPVAVDYDEDSEEEEEDDYPVACDCCYGASSESDMRECRNCGNDCCSDCMDRCSDCNTWVCSDCTSTCDDCGERSCCTVSCSYPRCYSTTCASCNHSCTNCDTALCTEHYYSCDCCRDPYCEECLADHEAPYGRCEDCSEPLTEERHDYLVNLQNIAWNDHSITAPDDLCEDCEEHRLAPHGRCIACHGPYNAPNRCYTCGIIFRTLDECGAIQHPLIHVTGYSGMFSSLPVYVYWNENERSLPIETSGRL